MGYDKKLIKIVTWVCDKCRLRNMRETYRDIVINDDICDFCHIAIHEPLIIDLAIKDNNKKGKK